jgi:hypothetical protein
MSVILTRVRFVESPAPGERILAEFKDPEARVAVASPLALEALAAPPGPRGEELLVLQAPVGAARDAPWRSQAQAWFDAPGPEDVPPAHIGLEGASVKWRPGRAVIEAPADRMDAMLLALVDFAFHERELRRLEAEIDANWPAAQADVPLMHRVCSTEAAREAAVAQRGTDAALRRLRCARLETRLLAPPAALGDAACKAGRKLRDEADVESRLETLDGRIEVYEYIYEVAGQRLSDYRHFRREYAVEIIIAVILAVEALLVAYEVYLYFQE